MTALQPVTTRADHFLMNTQRTAAPRHHLSSTRTVPVDPRGPGHRAPEVTPNPLAALLFCLLVLAGGAFAGHQWLTETCPTAPSAGLQEVCTAVLG